MEKKQKILVTKKLLLVLLWCIVLYACFKGYELWQYGQAHPQERYEVSYFEKLPEEALIKISMYRNVSTPLYLGLLLVFVYYILDYFYEPETHFATPIMGFIKKYMDKIEDEEENNEKPK